MAKEDLIEFQGFKGTVKEIQIFNTHLNTVDNKLIIIPNTNISSSSLVNYSAEPRRRVDFTFGISYNDDVEKAKSIVKGHRMLKPNLKKVSTVLRNERIFLLLMKGY